jgi:hypothetical protein
MLALQQVPLPTYLRPDPFPTWVLQTDEQEIKEFKGKAIGVSTPSSAMAADDKAKVADMAVKEVDKHRPGTLTGTDYLRMFKPANSSASWYTVAKMDINVQSQKVGKCLPAAPVVCPVQCGPEDTGGYVDAWGLEGSGAAMGDSTEEAIELLAQVFARLGQQP